MRLRRRCLIESARFASRAEEPDHPDDLAYFRMAETVTTGAQPSRDTPLSMTFETPRIWGKTLWHRVAGGCFIFFLKKHFGPSCVKPSRSVTARPTWKYKRHARQDVSKYKLFRVLVVPANIEDLRNCCLSIFIIVHAFFF